MAALAQGAASAQGRLEAQYEATLAGVPVGKGAWNIDIGDDQYSASAFGGTSGILKAFASGSGTGAAQGRVVNGALVATNYSASTTTTKKSEAIHMTLVNGNVKEFGIEPEPPVDPDRIPVTEAQRKVFNSVSQKLLNEGGVQAIMLGGTDLALAFNEKDVGFPIVDCAGIHADAIARLAIP